MALKFWNETLLFHNEVIIIVGSVPSPQIMLTMAMLSAGVKISQNFDVLDLLSCTHVKSMCSMGCARYSIYSHANGVGTFNTKLISLSEGKFDLML